MVPQAIEFARLTGIMRFGLETRNLEGVVRGAHQYASAQH